MPGRSAVGVAGQPRRSARLAGVGAGLGVVAAIALFTHSEVPAARVPDGFPQRTRRSRVASILVSG